MDRKRCLVTGATGFIGRNLVAELRRRDWDVVALGRRPTAADDPGILGLEGDLRKPETMDLDPGVVGRIDVLFHLAALLPTHQPPADAADYLAANAVATTRLLQSAVALEIPAFVYASSLALVGKPEVLPVREDHPVRPFHAYHVSKYCGELACEFFRRSGGPRVTSLRITSPYGPGMPTGSVLARFVKKALDSEDLAWFGSGQRTQNFVHVQDVVRGLLLAGETPNPGVYNLAGAPSIGMRDLAERVVRLTPGCRSRVAAAGQPDPQDDFRWEIDLGRAEAGLGYRPEVSLDRGIAELAESLAPGGEAARRGAGP